MFISYFHHEEPVSAHAHIGIDVDIDAGQRYRHYHRVSSDRPPTALKIKRTRGQMSEYKFLMYQEEFPQQLSVGL